MSLARTDMLPERPLPTGQPPMRPTAALVTGAARRIGRAIAVGLAEAGYAVAMHASARSAAEAESVARDLRQRGCRAVVVVADLTDPAAIAAAFADAAAALGPLDL